MRLAPCFQLIESAPALMRCAALPCPGFRTSFVSCMTWICSLRMSSTFSRMFVRLKSDAFSDCSELTLLVSSSICLCSSCSLICHMQTPRQPAHASEQRVCCWRSRRMLCVLRMLHAAQN